MLGPFGIWARELRFGDRAEAVEAVGELEQIGYSALWIPGGTGGDVLDVVETMLRSTTRATVATGILNVWEHDPAEVAATGARLHGEHRGRFLLGLGVGHARFVDESAPGRYARPVATMAAYLDALDGQPASPSVPRVLAALAPQMVDLAAGRSDGVHPYLTPVEHTRWVRERLGPGAIVATALAVVLEPDVDRARAEARLDLGLYLTLPNYVRTWQRLGYDDTDLLDGGSDRLVDALYGLGDAGGIAARVQEHLAAGASHVCIRVITNQLERLPRAEWRQLASALSGIVGVH
ncbi:MAG: TIGR03620 family F420-dependent LLM class oxidoreductase [Gaiellales bacterium]